MTKPALQLNQLFADPLLAQSLKGGNPLLGKLLQGGKDGAQNAQAFGGLLSGLMTVRKNPLLEMSPSTDAPKTDITTADLLKGLPEDLLALINANSGAQKGDDITDGILNALSSPPAQQGKNNLFAMIDDPELASALAGLAAKIQSLQTGVEPMLQTSNLNINSDLGKLHAFAQRMQNDTTLTIADMDMDTFQAFKKLAFADIAPYLTQPRNVVVDGKSVMKVAGGPAFLNEGDTDMTVLATDLALQSAIVQTPHNPAPMAIDTLLLAQANQTLAAPQNAANTPSGTTPMAALLAGETLSPQSPNGAQTPTSATPAQTISIPTPNVASPATSPTPNTAAAPSTAQSRGFADMDFAGPLDNTQTGESFDLLTLKPAADSNNPQNAASSLLNAARAGQPHVSTHLVSVTIGRNLNPSTPGTERNLTINMEPESLGRVQVTLQFGEDKTLKVRLVAERPEALALLQKDVGVLERTLSAAGLDTSGDDAFTFDLASDDNFAESMPQESGDNAQNSAKSGDDDAFGTPLANIETVMPIFVDPNTGLTHVNIVV